MEAGLTGCISYQNNRYYLLLECASNFRWVAAHVVRSMVQRGGKWYELLTKVSGIRVQDTAQECRIWIVVANGNGAIMTLTKQSSTNVTLKTMSDGICSTNSTNKYDCYHSDSIVLEMRAVFGNAQRPVQLTSFLMIKVQLHVNKYSILFICPNISH